MRPRPVAAKPANGIAGIIANVPAATFEFLAGGRDGEAVSGEAVKQKFAAWVASRSGTFRDWRDAWDVYRNPAEKKAEPQHATGVSEKPAVIAPSRSESGGESRLRRAMRLARELRAAQQDG